MNLDEVTPDPLERPVWHCLTGPQAHLARGGAGAWRLDPGHGPFAAAADAGAEAQAAMAGLLAGERDYLLVVEAEQWPTPPGLHAVETVPLVQMVHDGSVPSIAGTPPVLLGPADVAAMRALVAATEPGPWADDTHLFGDFFGIRDAEGELVAMAGERFRPAPGLAELSGVCTAAKARGQGLAARVIARVLANMAARGDRALLHCRADNAGAIRLYRSLGFETSREMVVTAFVRG